MSKYRIFVLICEENSFWAVVDDGRLIKNPTKEDLYGTKLKSYNETNICSRCREEKERYRTDLTDRSILYPGNAIREMDKTGKGTGQWVCIRHWGRDYSKYNSKSKSNIIRSLADRRTDNLEPNSSYTFGDDCEELTSRAFGVDNLNKINDDYRSPIDHSRHPILGIIQTKGAIFSRDIGAKGGWYTTYGLVEYEKEYDNMILWCANEDGEIIERGYIIPKIEVDKRQSVTIVKDPSRGVQWYEKYRIIGEKEIDNVNKIWKNLRSKKKRTDKKNRLAKYDELLRRNMLFGTSGIRGDAENFFTNQFCFDIGRTFHKFLTIRGIKGDIAIGMDPRESSQRIKDCIINGLVYEGRGVFDEGISPSPAMNYILIVDKNVAGSIMVTGSHIRPDFNGIKFFWSQRELLKEEEKEIETIYNDIKEKIDYKEREKRYKKVYDNKANLYYKEMLLRLARTYPEWKIVLDLCNGCQSKVMPGLFEKLGIETIIVNGEPIPEKFIARDTETEDAIKDLQKKVKEVNANFGISFDGDGDRLVFVDEDGKFIPGDYSGTLIAKYSNTPVVITPINTSQVIDHIGKPVIRTKVGSPYVVKAILENDATFGFEANGGGISKEIMLSRDAGSATIKILNILNKSGKTLKNLIEELPQFFICRTKIDCPMNIYPIILENVKKKFENVCVRIDDIDGLKFWKENNSWILFRPSSNAPEFRVFTEANTEEEALKLCREGIVFVGNIRDANI